MKRHFTINLTLTLNSKHMPTITFKQPESFEKIFNRRVDLVTDKSLSNPYFVDAANATKQQICSNFDF